jgi:hypothetical protein
VDACGIDLETDRRWERAWIRLAGQYQQISAAGEAEKLRQENEELRRQLTESQHRADADLKQVRADAEARKTSAEHELEELRRQLAAAKRHAATAERRATHEQADAQMVKSQRDMAIRRATAAESFLGWERKLSDGHFVSVTLSQLGEGVTEGTVTGWLRREGDHVDVNEPLIEVSTGEGVPRFPLRYQGPYAPWLDSSWASLWLSAPCLPS